MVKTREPDRKSMIGNDLMAEMLDAPWLRRVAIGQTLVLCGWVRADAPLGNLHAMC